MKSTPLLKEQCSKDKHLPKAYENHWPETMIIRRTVGSLTGWELVDDSVLRAEILPLHGRLVVVHVNNIQLAIDRFCRLVRCLGDTITTVLVSDLEKTVEHKEEKQWQGKSTRSSKPGEETRQIFHSLTFLLHPFPISTTVLAWADSWIRSSSVCLNPYRMDRNYSYQLSGMEHVSVVQFTGTV